MKGCGAVQAQAAAHVAFDSILDRQALVDKARQENQLAVRYKAVLGFGAKLDALCQSRQYGQVRPAYEQATAVIQAQAAAALHVNWSILQTLMDQVSLYGLAA